MPGAFALEAQQFAHPERGFALAEIFGGYVEFFQVFVGKVDASESVIVVNVANDVGELEGQAEFFGEIECFRIAELKDMRAGKADGARNPVAIFAEAVEGRIGLDGEVHFRPADQVVEVAGRHFVALHGVDQGGKDGRCAGWDGRFIGNGAGSSGIEGRTPLGQAALFGSDVVPFVSDVVD